MTQTQKKYQTHINRRSFLKRGSWAAIGFLAMCAVPFYSHFAERRWIETTELELSFPRLPSSFDGMRILHISDIHYGFYFDAANLIKLVSTINDLKPDMIVFTGDFFDAEVLPYVEQCKDALARLSTAPLGNYIVMGNHDYYIGFKNAASVIEVFEAGRFKVLRNESTRIQHGGQSIQIAGVDDMFLGKPSIKQTFLNTVPNMFTLFLAHEAEFADQAAEYRYDLQFSGHSHGGQIRLPFLGAVMTPPGGKKYVQGLYTLNDNQGTRMIYTNRGIGTTHIPIRFLCRPEITVITMRSIP